MGPLWNFLSGSIQNEISKSPVKSYASESNYATIVSLHTLTFNPEISETYSGETQLKM